MSVIVYSGISSTTNELSARISYSFIHTLTYSLSRRIFRFPNLVRGRLNLALPSHRTRLLS